MNFRILGPLEVVTNGQSLALGGSKQRAVLAVLLLNANETVSVDRLIDALWGESAPAGAIQSVRVHISRLRKVLEDEGGTANGPSVLVTTSGGYELRVRDEDLDLVQFEHLVAEGRRALSKARPERAAELLGEALGLWRGPALADLAFEPFAQAEAEHLDELRVAALEDRVEADLELGRHAAVASELDPLIAQHPLRERLRRLQMLALYRCGRQAEALEAYRKARQTLVEEIGVEPSPKLRELHDAMLRQDPALEAPAPPPEPSPGPAPKAPAAARRGPHRVHALLIVGALALAAVLVSIGLLSGDDETGATIAENAVGLIDPSSGEVRSQIALGGGPGPSAADAGSVWVANTLEDTVSRIDADSGQVTAIDIGGEPAGVTIGAGFAWVTDATEGTVEQLDAESGRVVGSLKVGNGPSGVAVAYGAVWALASVDGELVRIDLGSGRVTDRVPVGATPTAIAAGANSLWVADEAADTIVRVEPDSGRVSEAIGVGHGPSGVAFGEDAVWVANRVDGTVSRIDPETNAVTSTVEVGAGPNAIAVAEGEVWVTGGDDGTASRLDPATGELDKTVEVGGSPSGLAITQGDVWTSVLASSESHRGGTLELALPAGDLYCKCVDPTAYAPGTVALASLAYDGLTGYRWLGGPAGSRLVGNLATDVPEPTDGGRSYVFELRPDLEFSDGAPVEPDDFRSSLERSLRLNPFGTEVYDAIVGVSACTKRSCDLSEGIETDADERTITIHLTEPDATLPDSLALPTASVVPSDSPMEFVTETPLPGTGPYRIAGFEAPGSVRLVRNEHFQVRPEDARPDGFADEINVEFAKGTEDPEDQVTAVLDGEADLMTASGFFGGPLSPDRVEELSVRNADRMHSAAIPQTDWMFLNVRRPPFDDVRVRQALNYAVDRRRLVELNGGPELAQSTCQFLPPGFPGHDPYCPYTLDPSAAGTWTAPDLGEAQRLVRASGTSGTPVTVWTTDEPERLDIARYFTDVLDQLGYRSSLKVVKGSFGQYFRTVADSRTGAQIGQIGWYADYLAPANFIQPNFGCDSFVPADPTRNSNLGQFCDLDLDAQGEAALAEADPAAASRAWNAIDRQLVDLAPAVPMFNRRTVVLVSDRVQNVEHHPYFGVLYDQMWVQ